MDTTRRWVLARAVQLAGGILVLRRPWRAVAQRGTTWTTRRATPQDVGVLVGIFNAHRAAGICPYADQMPVWTAEKAQAFLSVYTGTLIVVRDGVPVGFGGLIDYSDPATSSSIAPGAEPEITVVAVDFERLAPREVVPAVQHLAAAMGRALQRLGFHSCRMRISARPMFASEAWFTRHMAVRRVRQRDGVDEALEVRFDTVGLVAELARKGL